MRCSLRAPGVQICLLARGKILWRRERQLRRRVSGRLDVDEQSLPVEVINGVARCVVAGIVRGAGACEDARGGNPNVEESDVVGRARECSA